MRYRQSGIRGGDFRLLKDLYQRLLEFTGDGVYQYTMDEGRLRMANRGFMRILELDGEPSSVVGRRLRDLMTYTEPEGTVRDALRDMGEIHNFAYHFRTLKGTEKWVLHDSQVTRDPVTGEKLIEAIVKDVTAQRQAEEAVAAEREWLAVTIGSIGDAVIATNTEGRIVLMNHVAETLTGWTQAEALGRLLVEVFRIANEQTGAPCEDPVAKVLQTGRVVGLANHTVLVARDGTRHIIADSGAPIFSRQGRILGVVLVFRDVTEAARMEAALAASEENYRSLFRGMTSAAALHEMVFDSQGVPIDYRFLAVNPSFETQTGLKAEAILGRTALEVMPNLEREWIERYGRVVTTGEPAHFEMASSSLNRIYEVSAFRPKPGHFVTLFDDVTKKRRVELEMSRADKLESLGLLAGGIAHDFNNILAAILGSVSLARSFTPPAENSELTELLVDVEKASLRARDLTQQLLTFAKGGAPIKQASDLNGIIRDSADFAVHGSRSKCSFHLAPDLRMTEVDPAQISRVVQNIVLNADEAMPEGGIIRISTLNVTLDAGNPHALPPGVYVAVTIQDAGVGIPPEHLKRIFDPYFTTKQKGSGLGLAIAYSVVSQHGGTIHAESKIGLGSTFAVLLPASKTDAATAPPPKTAPIVTGGRILIMDDDAAVLSTLSRILKRSGCEVHTAENGHQAVELYAEAAKAHRPFDVVLLDLTVPGGMGGRETLDALRVKDPHVRAIASSGYSNAPILANPNAFGFDACMAKPYRAEDVLAVLGGILSRPPPFRTPEA